MKVIGAGFGRTGTMSMQAALNILGYRCYHMKEVTENPGHIETWHEFVAGRAAMDWQTLFKDYEATVDFPACTYYRELMQAFPDAKVVLNVRESDRWFDSFLTLQQTTDRFRVFRFLPNRAAVFEFCRHAAAQSIRRSCAIGPAVWKSSSGTIAKYKSWCGPERLLVFSRARWLGAALQIPRSRGARRRALSAFERRQGNAGRAGPRAVVRTVAAEGPRSVAAGAVLALLWWLLVRKGS